MCPPLEHTCSVAKTKFSLKSVLAAKIYQRPQEEKKRHTLVHGAVYVIVWSALQASLVSSKLHEHRS